MEISLLKLEGLFEDAGLQVYVKVFNPVGEGRTGHQVRGGQKSGAKIRRVGGYSYIIRLSQGGDFDPFTHPANLDHTRLDVCGGPRLQHLPELKNRAGIFSAGDGHSAETSQSG